MGVSNARTKEGLPCGVVATVQMEDGAWTHGAALRDRETEGEASLGRGHYTQVLSPNFTCGQVKPRAIFRVRTGEEEM